MANIEINVESNETAKLSVVRKSTDVIDSRYELDTEIVELLESYEKRYLPVVEEKLTICSHNTLTKQHLKENYRLKSSVPLSFYICNAFRHIFSPPTDIGIVNLGGIRDGIEKGIVKWSTINKVWPFQDDIHAVKLSGRSIKSLLKRNARRLSEESGSGMVSTSIYLCLILLVCYFIISSIQIYHFAGLQVEYDEDESENVVSIREAVVNGKTLDDSYLYTISITSYLLENDMEGIAEQEKIQRHSKKSNLRDLLIEYTRSCKEIVH